MFLLDELAKMLMDQEQLLPDLAYFWRGVSCFCWSKKIKNPTESSSHLCFLLSTNCCFSCYRRKRASFNSACVTYNLLFFESYCPLIHDWRKTRIENWEWENHQKGILKLELYKNPWFGKTENLNPSLSVKKKHSDKSGKSSSSSQGLVKETTWGIVEINRFASSFNRDQPVPSTLDDAITPWLENKC